MSIHGPLVGVFPSLPQQPSKGGYPLVTFARGVAPCRDQVTQVDTGGVTAFRGKMRYGVTTRSGSATCRSFAVTSKDVTVRNGSKCGRPSCPTRITLPLYSRLHFIHFFLCSFVLLNKIWYYKAKLILLTFLAFINICNRHYFSLHHNIYCFNWL